MTQIASSSVTSAHARFSSLAENMIAELQKLQASSKDLSSSLSETLHSPKIHLPSLPPQVHDIYVDFAENISSTITELRGIAAKELPWSEKLPRMRQEVSERVSPLLETIRTHVSELLARGKNGAAAASEQAEATADGDGLTTPE